MSTTSQQPDARLFDFVVTHRPLASTRKAKFKPFEGPWWENQKLRHAAEGTLFKTKEGTLIRNKYVEDGATYFKVRYEPNEETVSSLSDV